MELQLGETQERGGGKKSHKKVSRKQGKKSRNGEAENPRVGASPWEREATGSRESIPNFRGEPSHPLPSGQAGSGEVWAGRGQREGGDFRESLRNQERRVRAAESPTETLPAIPAGKTGNAEFRPLLFPSLVFPVLRVGH